MNIYNYDFRNSKLKNDIESFQQQWTTFYPEWCILNDDKMNWKQLTISQVEVLNHNLILKDALVDNANLQLESDKFLLDIYNHIMYLVNIGNYSQYDYLIHNNNFYTREKAENSNYFLYKFWGKVRIVKDISTNIVTVFIQIINNTIYNITELDGSNNYIYNFYNLPFHTGLKILYNENVHFKLDYSETSDDQLLFQQDHIVYANSMNFFKSKTIDDFVIHLSAYVATMDIINEFNNGNFTYKSSYINDIFRERNKIYNFTLGFNYNSYYTYFNYLNSWSVNKININNIYTIEMNTNKHFYKLLSGSSVFRDYYLLQNSENQQFEQIYIDDNFKFEDFNEQLEQRTQLSFSCIPELPHSVNADQSNYWDKKIYIRIY